MSNYTASFFFTDSSFVNCIVTDFVRKDIIRQIVNNMQGVCFKDVTDIDFVVSYKQCTFVQFQKVGPNE